MHRRTYFSISLLQLGLAAGAGVAVVPQAFTVTDGEVVSKNQQRGLVNTPPPSRLSLVHGAFGTGRRPPLLLLAHPFKYCKPLSVKRLLTPDTRGYCVPGP